jgi:hypothetical protein
MELLTSAAGRPALLAVTHTYSVPLASASKNASAAATPFLRQKPSSALVGAPSAPKAACNPHRTLRRRRIHAENPNGGAFRGRRATLKHSHE